MRFQVLVAVVVADVRTSHSSSIVVTVCALLIVVQKSAVLSMGLLAGTLRTLSGSVQVAEVGR